MEPYEFKQSFPEFDDVDHGIVENVLKQSGAFVDSSWGSLETVARGNYVAHHLTLRGLGVSATAQLHSNDFVKKSTSGPTTTEYFDRTEAAMMKGYEATPYGVVFAQLKTQLGPAYLSVP